MRFAVVVLAVVLAVASAQTNSGKYVPENTGRYNPFNNQYNNQYNNRYNNQYNRYNKNPYNRYNNQYNRYNNQYNPFDQYNQYNRNQNYNPFASSTTPFPRPSVTVTPAPPKVTVEPAVSPVSPVVTPAPFAPVVTSAPVAPVNVITASRIAADDRAAETVRYGNDINPDGSYSYFYETNNGIAAQAQGVPRDFGGNPPVVPVVSQGAFSWYAPEGNLVSINWVADEDGYKATGDAIPQPPPLPDQIARAFAYIARTAPVPAVRAAAAASSE